MTNIVDLASGIAFVVTDLHGDWRQHHHRGAGDADGYADSDAGGCAADGW